MTDIKPHVWPELTEPKFKIDQWIDENQLWADSTTGDSFRCVHVDDVRDLVVKLTEPKFGEWYPIDTAPRDGTEILCWPRKYAATCYYQNNVWHKGWVHCGHRSDIIEAAPEMWAPLPAPPK